MKIAIRHESYCVKSVDAYRVCLKIGRCFGETAWSMCKSIIPRLNRIA